MFNYYDVSPPVARIVGTSLWEIGNPSGEPALRGGWYTAPEGDARRAFMAEHESTFGASPDPVSALAFDAVSLVLDLIERNPDDRRIDADRLVAGGPYRASGPEFTIGADRVARWPIAVYEVGRAGVSMVGEPRSVEPVPVADAGSDEVATAQIGDFAGPVRGL